MRARDVAGCSRDRQLLQVVVAFQGTMDRRDYITNVTIAPSKNSTSAHKARSDRSKDREGFCSGLNKRVFDRSVDVTSNALPGKQHSGFKRSWQSVKDVVFLQVGTGISLLVYLLSNARLGVEFAASSYELLIYFSRVRSQFKGVCENLHAGCISPRGDELWS